MTIMTEGLLTMTVVIEKVVTERCIKAFDLTDPSCPKREIIEPSSCPMDLDTTKEFMRSNIFWRCLTFLVESSGDLLFVVRFSDIEIGDEVDEDDDLEEKDWVNEDYIPPFYPSVNFDVYKLNFDQNKWERVDCISDRALFVGRNHSFSLSTSDYPELRENSIYFTVNYQDCDHVSHDSGIFHLKDKSITPYCPLTFKSSKLRSITVPEEHQPAWVPVWVAPDKL
ncbi:uncharacterized protein LOC132301543 [Cornus florida]|uniref:uncharacterized protein LOC132301543 n=1 Tax=Cornus florida TaxID=4283 RepID=UPI00289C3B96|nr:uncharacterized protein LOC132301543 [Cornus florida]